MATEAEFHCSSSSPTIDLATDKSDKGGRVRVNKKTLLAMMEQFQRAIESINTSDDADHDDDDGDGDGDEDDGKEACDGSSMPSTDELCDLVKSKFECPKFLRNLESVHGSASQSMYASVLGEGNSWDMVVEDDLWESGNANQDDYVLVGKEDILDGIAGFMAAYLLSLKETKDLNPNQLQEALSKVFSLKKKKGKLKKAWDGSIVIYNVASWGATAIGIYQNPAIIRAASSAFWTSCGILSKLF